MLKKLLYMRVWVFILFICLSNAATQAAVTFKEVTVTGVGSSLEEATNNALTEAISMVNGKNIQTKTVIKTMSGDAKSQNSADIQALGKFFASVAASANDSSAPAMRDKDPEDKTPKYTQEYVKEMIDKTKGGIKSYEVLKKSKNSDGMDIVKIKAQVAVFDLPKESMRTRIAVMPFKFFDVKGDTERYNRLLTQGLNNYLVQTKKFTVLDRDFVAQVDMEKQGILDGKTPASEMAKIGNEISADFVLVGAVESFYVKTKTKIMRASGKEVKKEYIFMHLSYRLIDVATKQINFSNTIKTTIPMRSERREADSKMTDKVSASLGEELLFSIYPVMVEKIKGKDIYLGMGGKQFKKGNIYEMFEKGEPIINSYTKEVLGATETLVGTIVITSVSNNYSKAKTIKSFDFGSNFEPGKYIVRPIQIDEEAAKKVMLKKAKEKIKEKRKKLQKSLTEDW